MILIKHTEINSNFQVFGAYGKGPLDGFSNSIPNSTSMSKSLKEYLVAASPGNAFPCSMLTRISFTSLRFGENTNFQLVYVLQMPIKVVYNRQDSTPMHLPHCRHKTLLSRYYEEGKRVRWATSVL